MHDSGRRLERGKEEDGCSVRILVCVGVESGGLEEGQGGVERGVWVEEGEEEKRMRGREEQGGGRKAT